MATTTMTPEAYEAYIRKHERWNFIINTADLTFFFFATSFIYGSTVLSLYASHLTDRKWLIGLLPAIQNVGYFLPQLLVARRAERLPRKKPMVVMFSVVERLPYILVTLTIFLWPGAPRWFSYSVVAICVGLATISGGLGGPAWNGMLAKVIRPERRGFFFGLSNALGGLLGMAGAKITEGVLADPRWGYPRSYGICFLFCFIFQVVSWIFLTLNRERPQESNKEGPSAMEYWRRLPGVLRSNPNFARYLGGRVLLILGGMATAFYIIYARSTFQVTDSFAGSLTFAALASQTVCTPLLGWLSDHRGHKWLTELAALIGLSAVLVALLAPGPQWFYLVFVLMNAASSAMMVAGMSLVMDFSPQHEVPTYAALSSTLLAVPILISPILGGWLADNVGFGMLFIVAMVFFVLGWAMMHWGVREPKRWQQAQE